MLDHRKIMDEFRRRLIETGEGAYSYAKIVELSGYDQSIFQLGVHAEHACDKINRFVSIQPTDGTVDLSLISTMVDLYREMLRGISDGMRVAAFMDYMYCLSVYGNTRVDKIIHLSTIIRPHRIVWADIWEKAVGDVVEIIDKYKGAGPLVPDNIIASCLAGC